jgi:serine/threonine protein kinase
MGEVYRARDTRLDRTVAIKILPEHISAKPHARERFEREARAVSSLNHPHICTLHDVGHQDGIDYLVMEYLEGETLPHRLKKGPLPPEQVLQYAIQMTEALDTAHKHGVIHRDLKPGNVMLVKSGVKLLDFGLAKVRAAGAIAGATALPTETAPLTAEGTILGTLQYMAPEQLEGKDADARTDIFALGAVIYEMATGRKAFGGKSQASLISAIMTAEPPPITAPPSLASPALEHVMRTCLAKDPDTPLADRTRRTCRTDMDQRNRRGGTSHRASGHRAPAQACPLRLDNRVSAIRRVGCGSVDAFPPASSRGARRSIRDRPASNGILSNHLAGWKVCGLFGGQDGRHQPTDDFCASPQFSGRESSAWH